jgi:hypothetical protein
MSCNTLNINIEDYEMGKMNAVGWFDIYVDDPFASPQ